MDVNELGQYLELLYSGWSPQQMYLHNEASRIGITTVSTRPELLTALQAQVSMYALGDRLATPSVKYYAAAMAEVCISAPAEPGSAVALVQSSIVFNIYTSTPSSDRVLRDLVVEYLEEKLVEVMANKDARRELAEIEGLHDDILGCVAKKRAQY